MSEKRKDSRGRVLIKGESQQKDGRYRYQYQAPDGKRKCVYAWDLAELREKERQVVIDETRGIDSGKADKITVNDLFETYIEGRQNLRETTLTGYEFAYDKYVRDRIGNKPISKVVYSTILNLYNTLLKEGADPDEEGNKKGISYGSLSIIDNILHPMFTLAIRNHYIYDNPTSGVLKEIRDNHDTETTDRYALSENETETFISYANSLGRYSLYIPLFVFLFGTGLRIGEALGLTWEDVDFKAGTINVNHSLTYKSMRQKKTIAVINPPKSKSGSRVLQMPKGVREALLEQRKIDMSLGRSIEEIDGIVRYKGCKKENRTCKDFVFINSRRTILKATCVNKVINEILAKYEIKELKQAREENREPILIRHFSVHNCRHTCCTRLCEAGMDLVAIRDWMGHSDINVTSKVYIEVTEKIQKAELEKVEGKFKVFEGLFKIG